MTRHVAIGNVVGIDGSGVKETKVRGIDITLQALQPIAFALTEKGHQLLLRQQRRLQSGQGGRLRARAHVHPDQAVAFGDLV